MLTTKRTYLHRSFLCVLLLLTLVAGLFTGCSAKNDDDANFTIVCSTFPVYDWVRELVRDVEGVDLTLLVDNGVDMHSYQATADDMITISDCDLMLYVGGESEVWIADALANKGKEGRITLSLMDLLGDKAKAEEHVEGMESDEEEHHADHEEEVELDEHVWLSLANAVFFTSEISASLTKELPEAADTIATNLSTYQEKLNALNQNFKDLVSSAPTKTILVGDRFPFRYLVDDYNLDYYAAFAGCSAETEASFDTIIFLAGKIDELGLNTVFYIDGSSEDIAKTIISNTTQKDQTLAQLHSMQSIGKTQIDDGTTYLSEMEANLQALSTALKE